MLLLIVGGVPAVPGEEEEDEGANFEGERQTSLLL